MPADTVVDFQLLIFRPVYSNDTGTRFVVRHREDFGVRRLCIRRKPLKVLLEYNTLPAKILELPFLPGDPTYIESDEDQAWQRIGSKYSNISNHV